MNNTPRTTKVDTLRSFALVGICVVNLPFLALPLEAQLTQPEALADRVALFAVEALFQAKFFLLFSFLFGWGIEVQARAAARAGVDFGPRYARRLGALAVMGVAHAVLVFTGDILLLYAVLGALVWPLRRWSPAALARFAGWMVPVAALAYVGLALLMDVAMAEGAAPAARSLGGSYAEAMATRWAEWPATFFFVEVFNGPLALAAFALGMAAAKTGFLLPGNAGFAALARRVPWLVAVGVPLNLFYAASTGGLGVAGDGLVALAGFAALAVGAPMLSAVYLVAVVRLDRAVRPGGAWLAAGRNSLTAYVLQGVIGGAVMGGYGLGLYGSLGHAALLGLSLAITAAVMAAATLWDRIAPLGPLEMVLRRVTRGGAA